MSYVRAKPDEKIRMAKIKRMRCVACWDTGLCCGPTEVHHTLSGGKRRGHSFTIPLGKWHHQGIPLEGVTTRQMRLFYGPSMRLESKAFKAQYGDDNALLAKVNQALESV